MREVIKKILACVLIALLGFGVGFSAGFVSGLNWVVDKGITFLKAQDVDFSLTAEQIVFLLVKYRTIIESGKDNLYFPNITI